MGNYILKTCEGKPWTNCQKNKEKMNNNLKNPLEKILANKNMQ
jgi:fatty acid/phospholipid biosynthesis enzyme